MDGLFEWFADVTRKHAMSKYTAPSDLDYYDEQRGEADRVPRTCATCGGDAWSSRSEPYQVRVLCDHCFDAGTKRLLAAMRADEKKGAA